MTSITVLHGTASTSVSGPLASSIGSILQELSVRLFPAMTFSWFSLAELNRVRNGAVRARSLCALGLLGGVIAWNSQDLGIAVVVSFTLVLFGAVPLTKLRQPMQLWLSGLAGGFAAYPLLALLSGNPVNLGYFALLSRVYENGFGASLIQVPGPVLVVLPLLLASAGVGWCLLWRQRTRGAVDESRQDYAVLTLALVGTWGLVGFIYYLNRSYASGQLQVLLMPLGVCLAALVSICFEARRGSARGGHRGWRRVVPTKMSMSIVPLTLAASLALAAILQSPNPRLALQDLLHPPAASGFSTQLDDLLGTVRAAHAYVRHRGGSLGYFGEDGNFITMVTGVQTRLLTDSPALAAASRIVKHDSCVFLRHEPTRWLVTSPSTSHFFSQDLCGLYRPVDVPGPLSGRLLHIASGTAPRDISSWRAGAQAGST